MSKPGSLRTQSTEQLVKRRAGLTGEGRFVDQTRAQLSAELQKRPPSEVAAAEQKLGLVAK